MQPENDSLRSFLDRNLTDLVVRLALIALLVTMSVKVFSPFAGLVLWGIILAVALYPLHQRLANSMGGRQGGAATLMVLGIILVLGVPALMLGGSLANQVHDLHSAFENDSLSLPPPSEKVAEWPLVGPKIYQAWNEAANNMSAFVQDYREQIKTLAKKAVVAAANTLGSFLFFIGAMVVAGIFMAYGESGSRAVNRIFCRVSSLTRGAELQALSTATIRSVALGVVGVAVIQALLLGVGFILAGVPAAGLLALLVMVIGILQLPAVIISIPVIIYLWAGGDASTTSNLIFTVYLLVAGMADNILKPLLLGRGVDAPMPVILIGALGGMVSGGIIGLFLGAVLLAVFYQLFMHWLDHPNTVEAEQPTEADEPGTEAGTQAGMDNGQDA